MKLILLSIFFVIIACSQDSYRQSFFLVETENLSDFVSEYIFYSRIDDTETISPQASISFFKYDKKTISSYYSDFKTMKATNRVLEKNDSLLLNEILEFYSTGNTDNDLLIFRKYLENYHRLGTLIYNNEFLRNLNIEDNCWEKAYLEILQGDFDKSETTYSSLNYAEKLFISLSYNQKRIEKLGYKTYRGIVNKLAEIKPLDPLLVTLIGYKLINDSKFYNFRAGSDYLKRAIIVYQNPDLYNLIAYSERQIGYKVESIKFSRAALEIDSLNWLNWYQLGTNLYLYNNEEAIRKFEKAIELGDSLESNIYLGKIYYENGDYNKALYYFRQRVAHSEGTGFFRKEAAKGIRQCLAKIEGKEIE
ncbi:MAG: hypothetical protein JXR48_13020 [Candidatus Delongbacteria bacterium]|nr:hypothetical protein [Candidatus Delongbacteria bacterium]MBN2835875.1 hypothetical protein [Candidatus Delongbacteria bacterium]